MIKYLNEKNLNELDSELLKNLLSEDPYDRNTIDDILKYFDNNNKPVKMLQKEVPIIIKK